MSTAAGLRQAASICLDLKLKVDRKIADNPGTGTNCEWRAQSRAYAVAGNHIMDALEKAARTEVRGRSIAFEETE